MTREQCPILGLWDQTSEHYEEEIQLTKHVHYLQVGRLQDWKFEALVVEGKDENFQAKPDDQL
jgi:hypothetical protein